MANTCETFNIEPSNVAHLIGSGFKSVTLLSMSKPKHLKKTATDFGVEERLKRCLNVLNDRRITALEPLHSLRRLLQSKRKLIFKLKHYEYLDLANVEAKKKLPLNRDYKMHQPMIARSTFKNYDTASLLGPRGQCYCNHSDIIKPRICLSSTSSSSGYSSGSSSMADVPDSPDSMKKLEAHFQAPPPSQATQIPPRLQQCQQRQPFIPFHRRAAPFIRYFIEFSMIPIFRNQRTFLFITRHLLPTTNLIHKTHPENRGCVTASGDHFPPLQRHHPRMHCPRPDCSWRLYSNQVEDHCLKMHRIAKDATGPIFTYTEVRQRINDPRTTNKFCGDVKLTLNTREVFDENKIQLWWGPAPFVFDNITFYLIVYKKIDQETGNAGRTMEVKKPLFLMGLFSDFIFFSLASCFGFGQLCPKQRRSVIATKSTWKMAPGLMISINHVISLALSNPWKSHIATSFSTTRRVSFTFLSLTSVRLSVLLTTTTNHHHGPWT